MEPNTAPAFEPSVRDVFRTPQSEAYAGVEAFARRVVHRHRPFGAPGVGPSDRLTREIESRWTLPRHLTDGLEVFDAGGFEDLAREWQQRDGYGDLAGEDRGPFVIPVDPVESPAGLMATTARLGRGRERLRAVTPAAAQQTPRRMPAARERWRSAGGSSFSPYPSRLGNAGRIEGTLLRFPEARALTTDADRRGIIVSDTPATTWGSAAASTLANAARSAEHLAADVVSRATPCQTTPVGLWLVPTSGPAVTSAAPRSPFAGAPPPGATRSPGRWQGGALSSVLHSPATTETFAIGAVAQRFLDAPEAPAFLGFFGTSEGGPPRVGYTDFDAVADRSVVAPVGGTDAPAGLRDVGSDEGLRRPDPAPGTGPARPAPLGVEAPSVRPSERQNTPAPLRRPAALLATQPLVLRSVAARTPTPAPAPALSGAASAAVAASPRVAGVPATAAPAPRDVEPGGRRPEPGAFAVPALSAPTTGRLSSTALPRLAREDAGPAATRAALAALSAPLALRLAADAQEAGDAIDLGHRRFEPAPLAPEYWAGLEVAETTLVAPAASATTTEVPGPAAAAERAVSGSQRPGVATRRPPAARVLPAAPAGTPTPTLRGTPASAAAPAGAGTIRPMTRAAIAPVLLPLLATAGLSSIAAAVSRPITGRTAAPSGSSAPRWAAPLRVDGAREANRGPVTADAVALRFARAPSFRGTTPAAIHRASGASFAPAERASPATPAFRTPAAPVFEAFAGLGAVGPSLPLAAAGAAGPETGVAAETLAARIEARFPADTAGAWGPRVVLAPAPSALALDAPETTWVAPVVPDAAPLPGETPATVRARPSAKPAPTTALEAVSAAPPASPRSVSSTTRPDEARTAARTPTLLSAGRPDLPGVLSPAMSASAASMRRPSVNRAAVSRPAVALGEGRPASASGRPIARGMADESPTAALLSDAAPAEVAARSTLARLVAAGAFGTAEARNLGAAFFATAGAMPPLGVTLSTPAGFAAVVARSWSAAAAALSFAAVGHSADVLSRGASDTGERALAFADERAVTFGGGALPSEPVASRLAESGEIGALVRAGTSVGTIGTPSDPASNDLAATRPDASSPTAARRQPTDRPQTARPPLGPGLDVGLGTRSEVAVLRLAGHAVLVPAAAVAALRSASTRPALLGALARLGSPALASLLAADAPETVFVDGGASPAPTSNETAAAAGAPGASGTHPRARSRSLLAAGFHEPRGLHTAGPAPVRAAGGRRAPSQTAGTRSEGTFQSSLAVFDAPSLATLVLPPGVEALPGPLTGAAGAAYSPGNIERALVAFEQVAARHPDATGQNGPGPHATASALLRATGASSGGGSAGILATPSEAPRPGASAGTAAPIADEPRALVQPQSAPQRQPVFGQRGPSVTVHTAAAPAAPRVMVETGARRSGGAGPLRSTDGERPARQAETGEQARHRLAEGQIEESLSPEEVDKIAHEVISQLKRQIELDAIRVGEDEWD